MSLIKSKTELEHQALVTLHLARGFDLRNWVCSDKPDLQSSTENYGIEVVQDVYENRQEAERFIETIWRRLPSESDRRKIKRLEKLGGSISIKDEVVYSALLGSAPDNPTHLIKAIIKKIDKINAGGYRGFERYGLYVFVGTTFVDENFCSYVRQVVDEVSKYQESCSIKYGTLYLDQLYTLVVCDMAQKTYFHTALSDDLRSQIYKKITELWGD